MWELDNSTGYAAERNWIRDKAGVHNWLVAVRATFDILPKGQLILSDEQPPPLLEPQYRGDPHKTSLLLDSDLLAEKPGTDIILDACAYSPRGRPASAVKVSLRVAGLSKSLIVYGTRVYKRGVWGVTTSSQQMFTIQPIQYEWAFGGSDLKNPDMRKCRIDERNPVGKGVALDTSELYGRPAHYVEYPGRSASKSGPAGFGPISNFWSPRRQRAGTYDANWEKNKKPLLPDDYDPSFALSAPDDQRLTQPLRGGVPFLLTNMTPEGILRFELPDIALRFKTYFRFREEEHRASLSTVFITPHAGKLSLVWQSALKVPALDTDYLDFTLITEGTEI
jgi:hypothetical protein